MPGRKIPELREDSATGRAYVYWSKKKTYLGQWGSSDAKIAYAEWISENISLSQPTDSESVECPRIDFCVVAYMAHATGYYSKQEVANISATMDLLIDSGAGVSYAKDFGPAALIELRNHVTKLPKSNDDPTPRFARTTVNAHVNRIRRMFRWCASRELIPASTFEALRVVYGLMPDRGEARESEPVPPVPVETVVATLPWVSPTVARMIQVQALCGMRPSEVCKMTPEAIDTSGKIWLYRPGKHKTSHRRKSLVKAVPVDAQSLIKDLMHFEKSEPLFSPVDSLEYWRSVERKPSKKSSPKKSRTPYTTASYGKAIVYGVRRAAKNGVEIPLWSPNQLRHFIGTDLRKSHGLEAAQIYLGHSKPDTTLIYAEASESRLKDIAEKLSSPFAGLPSKPDKKKPPRPRC